MAKYLCIILETNVTELTVIVMQSKITMVDSPFLRT